MWVIVKKNTPNELQYVCLDIDMETCQHWNTVQHELGDLSWCRDARSPSFKACWSFLDTKEKWLHIAHMRDCEHASPDLLKVRSTQLFRDQMND